MKNCIVVIYTTVTTQSIGDLGCLGKGKKKLMGMVVKMSLLYSFLVDEIFVCYKLFPLPCFHSLHCRVVRVKSKHYVGIFFRVTLYRDNG